MLVASIESQRRDSLFYIPCNRLPDVLAVLLRVSAPFDTFFFLVDLIVQSRTAEFITVNFKLIVGAFLLAISSIW